MRIITDKDGAGKRRPETNPTKLLLHAYQVGTGDRPRADWDFIVDALNLALAAARAKGYDVGLDEGYNEGYDNGHSEGYDSGYKVGYNKGYNQGYDAGRSYLIDLRMLRDD